MSAAYLVDRSPLARMPSPSVRARLGPIIEGGQAATCSIVELEVLFSARNHADHEATRARRNLAYTHIPLTQAMFDRAVEVQGLLAQTGRHRIPIPDLVIAAAAEANGLTVLHYDADFEHVASVTGQPMEWVVPRGSI